jgi:hypothetical protein
LKIEIGEFFENVSEKIQIWLKSYKNNGTSRRHLW